MAMAMGSAGVEVAAAAWMAESMAESVKRESKSGRSAAAAAVVVVVAREEVDVAVLARGVAAVLVVGCGMVGRTVGGLDGLLATFRISGVVVGAGVGVEVGVDVVAARAAAVGLVVGAAAMVVAGAGVDVGIAARGGGRCSSCGVESAMTISFCFWSSSSFFSSSSSLAFLSASSLSCFFSKYKAYCPLKNCLECDISSSIVSKHS
jgi:hypothetical protein